MFWSMLVNVGVYVGVSLVRQPGAAEHGQAVLFVDAIVRAGRCEALARPGRDRRAARLARAVPRTGPGTADAAAVRLRQGHCAGRGPGAGPPRGDRPCRCGRHGVRPRAGRLGGRARSRSGSSEVMEILDEASQVREYSRRLEQKSRELEAATAELREANAAAHRAGPAQGRLRLDRVTRAADPADLDPRLLGDPARQPRPGRRRARTVPARSSSRRPSASPGSSTKYSTCRSWSPGTFEWVISEVDIGELVSDSVAATTQLFAQRGIRLDGARVGGRSGRARRPRPGHPGVDEPALERGEVQPRARPASTSTSRTPWSASTSATTAPASLAEHRGIIFERFRQGGDVGGKRPSGTGLGLPISREIIEHLGGTLWVDSTPGCGATFSFTLPALPKDRS